LQDSTTLHHLGQEGQLKLEISRVKGRILPISPQRLQHQIPTRKQVSLHIQFNISTDQPEIQTTGVHLHRIRNHSVQFLDGLALHQEVQVLFPDHGVLFEFAAGAVIQVENSPPDALVVLDVHLRLA
jgi:hypothetical protein